MTDTEPQTIRLRRSELAVPAANERFVQKAAESEADLIFLDLEDATAPEMKVGARDAAVEALNGLDWGNKLRTVRVNDHATEWAVHDVVSIVEGAGENLDLIILPKVKQARDLWFFETMLDSLEQALGLERKIGLEALIEEAEGLANVEQIAMSSDRLEALILGFGDLSASMGMRYGHELDKDYRYPGDLWHAHRVRMFAACRAAGIDAIDGPFANFNNDKRYSMEATWAAALGAVGKWCIHPNQIALANEVFAPSPREIEQAQKMVDLYNESLESGAGAGGKGRHPGRCGHAAVVPAGSGSGEVDGKVVARASVWGTSQECLWSLGRAVRKAREMSRFEGRAVVVTGAGSGFGRAISHRFAAEGARVLVSDIHQENGDAVTAEIHGAGGEAVFSRADVSKAAEVEAMIETAVSSFGQIDVLVNNAGYSHMSKVLWKVTEEEYDGVFAVNAKGTFLGCKYAIPHMLGSGGGVIINTASIGAVAPRPGVTPYNATKGAVMTMTRGLAMELANKGIRVNAVNPVAADTDFMRGALGTDSLSDDARAALTSTIPIGRMTDPMDVAEAVLFLASDQAAFLTGVCLPVDGGRSIS